jgi:hypothetical protein
VSQFKRAVIALLRVSAVATFGERVQKILGPAAYAVAAQLLSSQVAYDAWRLEAGLQERLWAVVRPTPWCDVLRGVAATLPGYEDDKPVVYYVKAHPQAYLGVRMELATLLQAQPVTMEALRIKPLQLFPLSKSNIPDFCRIDFHGMRTLLVRHWPDVLTRTSPDKVCRNTSAAVTSRMAAVVWNAAFKTTATPFRAAKMHARWSVFGGSVQTDGISLRVQRIVVDAKPEHVAVPRIYAGQYENVNHGWEAIRPTAAQSAITSAANNAALVDAPPRLPPTDGEGDVEDPDFLDSLGLTVSGTNTYAKEWRARAKILKTVSVEAQAWARISTVLSARRDADRALVASPPAWVEGTVLYDARQVVLIAKTWAKRRTRDGDNQARAWRAHGLVLGEGEPPSYGNKRAKTVVKAAKKGKEVAEFLYVHHLSSGHAREKCGAGLRLVGVDPNKAVLMQCVEIPAWVDEGKPEECGRRHATKWLRVTQNQRRFETKTRYLKTQRELLIIQALGRGVDVKKAEAELRGVFSTSVDVPGFTAYLVAKHACNAIVWPVYVDPAFRRLRWQGFRTSQRADANVIKRFTAAFGGPATTAVC